MRDSKAEEVQGGDGNILVQSAIWLELAWAIWQTLFELGRVSKAVCDSAMLQIPWGIPI